MGIDVEDVKLCVCRIVHFSLRVSRRFVQKHPYVSGTLLFLFILYIFFPSVLSFLFYSLPFLGLAVILFAYWTSKKSTIRVEKKEERKLAVSEQWKKKTTTTTTATTTRSTIYRNRSAYLRNATSRRQRFTDKSESWKAESPVNDSVGRTDQSIESDSSESSIEAKKETQPLESENNASTLSTTSVDKDIEVSGQNDTILVSELLVKPDLAGFDGSSSQTTKSDSGGDETKIESSEDAEDEDEEEAQEDRNKAVEWTEDDQKNLMDLGLSEIERNRRLESLIARRRARKSYKRKVEETAVTVDIVPPGQVPKIITTRYDPLDVSEFEGVQLPGSAPSILLPMRNPFDLPYDPHEEKPNLMADSFQQEFTAAHQKELAFCRHESFCFGPAFPDEVVGVGMGYHPRYRRPSISLVDKGEHDWLIEQLLFKGAEKNPIAVETRGVQTVDSSQTGHENATELESNQEKEIPADSESEFEMEPQLTPDGNAQASPSSSSDNPEAVICDDVGVISKTFESTLSSALNKSLNCRIPKSRLIKEPLCDFSPTGFEKNKMDERFLYPEKVACHTPTYSIASDLQVEVSEIGSPPTVDGNNTDAESLNPDWEIEKEVNFGGEQDDMSPMTVEEVRSNEIVSGLEEEGEVKARRFSVPDNALPPKTIQGAIMAEELVDHPSQVVPQMPEELSIPIPTDDEEEATNHIIDQKDAKAQANMKNMEKTSEDVVNGGLDILTKQEDDGKKTRSLEEETDLKYCKSSDDGSDNSSGYRAESDHEHSEEGSRNLDQIKGHGDLVEPRKIEEQLEFIQDNKNQPNVVESEFWSSKDALKSTVEDNSVTDRGVPLDSNDIICSDASQNQVNAVQIEFQKSNEAMNSTVEQDLVIQKEPQDHTSAELSPPESSIEEQIHVGKVSLPQDFMVSPENDDPKTREKDDHKPADAIEIKSELIKDLSEQNGEKSNLDPMDDLEKTDQNLSSTNPALDADLKISEVIVQGDQATTNQLTEIPAVEVQVVAEPAPDIVTNKNIEVQVVTEPALDIVTDKNQEIQVVTEPDIVTNKNIEVQVVAEPTLDIVTNKNREVQFVTESAPDIVTNNESTLVTNKNIEVQVVTEPTPDIVTHKNIEGDRNYEVESESHRFNKQESDEAEEREMEFDNDMESYSKDLNGNEEKGNVMGLQKPTGLAHESPLESSLYADKGSQ